MAPTLKTKTVRSATTAKVLKALSVFGGVQAVTIICSVFRAKFVALWIGPAGVGLITLYNSTIDLLSNTTQLNLRQSAVRDISTSRDKALVVAVTRRIALLLGVVGMLLVLLASHPGFCGLVGHAAAVGPGFGRMGCDAGPRQA